MKTDERASLEAGPALRRIYSVLYGTEALAPIAPLGFEVLPGARDIEHRGAWYRPIVCDLGPESVGANEIATDAVGSIEISPSAVHASELAAITTVSNTVTIEGGKNASVDTTCPAGSQCNLDCSGGNCQSACVPGAGCNVACSGGGCRCTWA